jgi:small-conductance mechanosensitive channel
MQTKAQTISMKILQAIVLVIAGIVILYYLTFFAVQLPFSLTLAIKIVVAIVLGYLAISAVAGELRKLITKTSGSERGATVATAFRYFGFILLAFVVLAIAGVSGTDLLASGTFTGLVLGLASQQTLSNIFAGLLILTSRPFLVGERITLSTWQWGFALPSYPPKFFSDNLLIPGYTGVVEDIRLNYTTVRLDDGIVVRLPNSTVIQASVIDHKTSERLVRVRYDVAKPVDSSSLVQLIQTVVVKNSWVTKPETVSVNIENITPTDVVVVIEAVCRGAYEPPARSAILLDLEKSVTALKEGAQAKGS